MKILPREGFACSKARGRLHPVSPPLACEGYKLCDNRGWRVEPLLGANAGTHRIPGKHATATTPSYAPRGGRQTQPLWLRCEPPVGPGGPTRGRGPHGTGCRGLRRISGRAPCPPPNSAVSGYRTPARGKQSGLGGDGGRTRTPDRVWTTPPRLINPRGGKGCLRSSDRT